jgi:hypothetical protein
MPICPAKLTVEYSAHIAQLRKSVRRFSKSMKSFVFINQKKIAKIEIDTVTVDIFKNAY